MIPEDIIDIAPPSDPLEDLEVWKVAITWDNDLYLIKYVPDLGYKSHEELEAIEREFFHDVMEDIGYKDSNDPSHTFIYSVKFRDEDIADREEDDMEDSANMLSVIPSYPTDNPMFRVRYCRKDIEDWLKNNRKKWLSIEVFEFGRIPAAVQRTIRERIREEQV